MAEDTVRSEKGDYRFGGQAARVRELKMMLTLPVLTLVGSPLLAAKWGVAVAAGFVLVSVVPLLAATGIRVLQGVR